MTRVRKGECRPSWKCSNVKVKASDFKISLVDPPLNRYWLESRLGSSISGPVPRKRSTTCNWSCTFQGASRWSHVVAPYRPRTQVNPKEMLKLVCVWRSYESLSKHSMVLQERVPTMSASASTLGVLFKVAAAYIEYS